MSRNPLVSIIINNYNYGRFLRDAINSAIRQTYSNIEVIVVDDGSNDNSYQIITQYFDTVIPIFKKNGGQASAFNIGFSGSKGEIIVFLDADDILTETVIEKAVQLFEEPDVAKVHWSLWRVDSSGNRNGGIVPSHPLAEGNLREAVIFNGPNHSASPPYSPPTSGNAWRRSVLERIIPIPETDFRAGADYYLLVLAPLFGTVRRLEEPHGLYRVHGSNHTLKPVEEYIKEYTNWFEVTSQSLHSILSSQGIKVTAENWPRESWYHRIAMAIEQIKQVIKASEAFILVDGDQWMTKEFVAGRRRISFIEKDGIYWGEPESDLSAIQEIEHQRAQGASAIFIAWPSFWWLDYYKGMTQHLRQNYQCVQENDLLVGFDLKNRLPYARK